jgi:hypothetical protein
MDTVLTGAISQEAAPMKKAAIAQWCAMAAYFYTSFS